MRKFKTKEVKARTLPDCPPNKSQICQSPRFSAMTLFASPFAKNVKPGHGRHKQKRYSGGFARGVEAAHPSAVLTPKALHPSARGCRHQEATRIGAGKRSKGPRSCVSLRQRRCVRQPGAADGRRLPRIGSENGARVFRRVFPYAKGVASNSLGLPTEEATPGSPPQIVEPQRGSGINTRGRPEPRCGSGH